MRRRTVTDLPRIRDEEIPWAGLTAYSYPQAVALERAEIDWILVGDSAGMVELGYSSTKPVTMNEMLSRVAAVRRGAPKSLVVGDMPLGSYEPDDATAVRSAVALTRMGDVDLVKLEGGSRVASRVRAISNAGIPVMGHIGLTPQSDQQFGGYRVQGKSDSSFEALVSDASSLFDAGAAVVLVEAVPNDISEQLMQRVEGTFFGIGAGAEMDGQLLILHDILGLYPDFRPKFAENFAARVLEEVVEGEASFPLGKDTMLDLITEAAKMYRNEVRAGVFPGQDFWYSL